MKPSVSNMSGYSYTLAERRMQVRWERNEGLKRSSGSAKCIKYAKNQLNRAERRHGKLLCNAN